MLGVARRYEDHEDTNCSAEDSYCMYFYNGLLYADGKKQPHGNAVNQGDKIGVMLDMDEGELKFFHNDQEVGQTIKNSVFTEGVFYIALHVFQNEQVIRFLGVDGKIPAPYKLVSKKEETKQPQSKIPANTVKAALG